MILHSIPNRRYSLLLNLFWKLIYNFNWDMFILVTMVDAALMASTGIGVSVQKALLDQTVESVSTITMSRSCHITE